MAFFLSFFRLDHQPVHQWDEARTGINAIEMLQNGDPINLHFGGEPDKIRAKPPLVIWMVAVNFQFFGYHTFSLRLHSAIATVFIFLLIFLIVRLYKTPIFALGVCMILLTVRAILGFHVGRTGDFDAVLLAFLLAGLYYFLQYLDFDRPKAVYGAGLFWSLAFLTKGPAAGILFPGIALYVLLSGRLKQVFKDPQLYKAYFLFMLFPIGWYISIYLWGVQLENPEVSGKNAFERMFLYDLIDRFTLSEFEGQQEQRDPLFFFRCLAENFKWWNYLFYGVVLGGAAQLLRSRLAIFKKKNNALLLLSICIWSTLALFLSLVTTAKFWYLAPAIPFIAITTLYGFEYLAQRYSMTPYLFLLIWVLAAYWRYLGPKPEAAPGSEASDFFTELIEDHRELIAAAPMIYVPGELPAQRLILELYFLNPKVKYVKNLPLPDDRTAGVIIFGRLPEVIPDSGRSSFFIQLGIDKNYAILQNVK